MERSTPVRVIKTVHRTSHKSVLFLAGLILVMLGLSACSVYTLNPRGKSDIKTIAIEPFENKTPEYGLADRLTEIVIDAFIADGNLKVVPAQSADVLLVAVLSDYRRAVEKFDENDQVDEYKVVMDIQITLLNPKDDSEIWQEQVRHEGIYNAASETEEDGQRRAGERMVETILNRTTKSW